MGRQGERRGIWRLGRTGGTLGLGLRRLWKAGAGSQGSLLRLFCPQAEVRGGALAYVPTKMLKATSERHQTKTFGHWFYGYNRRRFSERFRRGRLGQLRLMLDFN